MKAIYTIFNERVYRINQDTTIPNELTFKKPGVTASTSEDRYNKELIYNLSINTLQKPGTLSNKELYEYMKDLMWKKMITEIPRIQDKYKLYFDYSIYENGHEIDHQSVMKPIDPRDKAYMLGVATNNETVYRRCKTFDPKIEFKTRNCLPHGIINTPKTNYMFKIHNVAIFEDFSDKDYGKHCSIECNPYDMEANSIKSSLELMTMIYSTEAEGIGLAPVMLNYVPRSVCVNMDIILANLIVAYNDKDIEDILVEIIESKYSEDANSTGSNDDDPSRLIQDEESKPSGDGDFRPDRRGYFDYYERCTAANPHSLLVVEDLIPDGYYDINTMIKKKMVVKDIIDIEVGEYVHYCESIVTRSCKCTDN